MYYIIKRLFGDSENSTHKIGNEPHKEMDEKDDKVSPPPSASGSKQLGRGLRNSLMIVIVGIVLITISQTVKFEKKEIINGYWTRNIENTEKKNIFLFSGLGLFVLGGVLSLQNFKVQ